MSGSWEYRTYRVEWQVQSVEVDQYDQNPRIYATASFPSREEADAHRREIAQPHAYVSGRWVPYDAPHSYVDCYVRYVEVRVDLDARIAPLEAALSAERKKVEILRKALDELGTSRVRDHVAMGKANLLLKSIV